MIYYFIPLRRKEEKTLLGEQLFAEEGLVDAQGTAVNTGHTQKRSASSLLYLPSTELCRRGLALRFLNQQGFSQELIFFISN